MGSQRLMLRYSHDLLWCLSLEQGPFGPCKMADRVRVYASEVELTCLHGDPLYLLLCRKKERPETGI